jgi:hypothetical protein
MNDAEVDELLEGALAGPGPHEVLRKQMLRELLASLARRRQKRTQWRMGGLAAAAGVIAAVSFLLGRCSAPSRETGAPPVATRAAGADQTVVVPSEVVAWLEAARFFKQLGMEERVAHAYERASALLPQEAAIAGGATGPVFAADSQAMERGRKRAGPVGTSGPRPPIVNMGRIMAQSFGE